uniref:uncharacterized protein At1g51745-like n=1 Tax=Erigeron canadensis TaxID=72917 RepID=UPI001CB93AE0|nr:uncharacterized protein At1g51745-like [Erigeron canadensis]
MGDSCEPNGQILDPKIGGLVWVRRRNGSWWPGRILGPDELPESCLIPIRSGTPVKLLGREDASVDWYNLERSKRVKAFRCGEFDECIEKAKIIASRSCKKTVKYARREDAIIHALKLEGSLLTPETTTSQELLHTTPSLNHSLREKSDNIQPDEENGNISDKLSSLEHISVSPQELAHSGALTEHSSEASKHQTPNDSEDDATEGSKKRMRGLKDIGIPVVFPSFKRRRSQVAHVHEYLKKKNRRRQLSKVLKSTMIAVPVMCEQHKSLSGAFLPGVSDNKVSGMEHSDLKSSFSDSTGDATNIATNGIQKENEFSSVEQLLENYDSYGRLFDVPFIRQDSQNGGSSPGLVSEKGHVSTGTHSCQSSLIETLSAGPDEFQESGSTSSGAAVGIDISHDIYNNGTSKWQHKGKRKSRNKSKPMQKFADTNFLNDISTEFITKSHVIEDVAEVTASQRLMPYRHSRFTVNPKYEPSDLAYKRSDMGTLYDVNIEVKMGHFPRQAPYISLMSKSTSQSVTGYSLEVEVLSESVSDLSLNGSECLSSSCELDLVNGNVRKGPEASKNPRRNNGVSSNKKIRRLSSLNHSKRPSSETGKLKRPDLACVPLKVVFGRINAALGITSTCTS